MFPRPNEYPSNPAAGSPSNTTPRNPFGNPVVQPPVSTQPSLLFGSPRPTETGFSFTPTAPASSAAIFGATSSLQQGLFGNSRQHSFGGKWEGQTVAPSATSTTASFSFGSGTAPEFKPGESSGGFGFQSHVFGAAKLQESQPNLFGQPVQETHAAAVSPSPFAGPVAPHTTKADIRPSLFVVASSAPQPNLFTGLSSSLSQSRNVALPFGSPVAAPTPGISFGCPQQVGMSPGVPDTAPSTYVEPARTVQPSLFGNLQNPGKFEIPQFGTSAQQKQEQMQPQAALFGGTQQEAVKTSSPFGNFDVPQKPSLFTNLQKTAVAGKDRVPSFGKSTGQQQGMLQASVFGNQQQTTQAGSITPVFGQTTPSANPFGKPLNQGRSSNKSVEHRQPLLISKAQLPSTQDETRSSASGARQFGTTTAAFQQPVTTTAVVTAPTHVRMEPADSTSIFATSKPLGASTHATLPSFATASDKPKAAPDKDPTTKLSKSETCEQPAEDKTRNKRGSGADASRRLFSHAVMGVEGRTDKRKHSASSSSLEPASKVTASPKEISMLTSILCNNVPGELNDRETLLEHFGQFGLVQRVTCNPKRKSATIHFQDHQSAEMAKKRGTNVSNLFPPLEIFWCSTRRLSGEGESPLGSLVGCKAMEAANLLIWKLSPGGLFRNRLLHLSGSRAHFFFSLFKTLEMGKTWLKGMVHPCLHPII